MSKIKDPNLFHAVFQATQRELRRGTAPTLMLFPGQTELVRSVDKTALYNNFHAFDPAAVQSRLTPHDAKKDLYRFSGTGPQGPLADRGGLYTAFHASAMTAETWHYTSSGTVPRALYPKAIIRLRAFHPLLVLDLSSPNGTAFLNRLELDPNVKSAQRHGPNQGQPLSALVGHDNDYSVSRSIGVAAAQDVAIDGLHVRSARETDRAGETGNNCVLFGPDGQPISQKIRAASVTLFTYSGKTKELTPTVHELDFDSANKSYKLRT